MIGPGCVCGHDAQAHIAAVTSPSPTTTWTVYGPCRACPCAWLLPPWPVPSAP